MVALPKYFNNFILRSGFKRDRDAGVLRDRFDSGRVAQVRRHSRELVGERISATLSAADYISFQSWLRSINYVGYFDYSPPGQLRKVRARLRNGRARATPLDGATKNWNVSLDVEWRDGAAAWRFVDSTISGKVLGVWATPVVLGNPIDNQQLGGTDATSIGTIKTDGDGATMVFDRNDSVNGYGLAFPSYVLADGEEVAIFLTSKSTAFVRLLSSSTAVTAPSYSVITDASSTYYDWFGGAAVHGTNRYPIAESRYGFAVRRAGNNYFFRHVLPDGAIFNINSIPTTHDFASPFVANPTHKIFLCPNYQYNGTKISNVLYIKRSGSWTDSDLQALSINASLTNLYGLLERDD